MVFEMPVQATASNQPAQTSMENMNTQPLATSNLSRHAPIYIPGFAQHEVMLLTLEHSKSQRFSRMLNICAFDSKCSSLLVWALCFQS